MADSWWTYGDGKTAFEDGIPTGDYRVSRTYAVRYDTGRIKEYRSKAGAVQCYRRGKTKEYGTPLDVLERLDIRDVSYTKVMV